MTWHPHIDEELFYYRCEGGTGGEGPAESIVVALGAFAEGDFECFVEERVCVWVGSLGGECEGG